MNKIIKNFNFINHLFLHLIVLYLNSRSMFAPFSHQIHKKKKRDEITTYEASWHFIHKKYLRDYIRNSHY